MTSPLLSFSTGTWESTPSSRKLTTLEGRLGLISSSERSMEFASISSSTAANAESSRSEKSKSASASGSESSPSVSSSSSSRISSTSSTLKSSSSSSAKEKTGKTRHRISSRERIRFMRTSSYNPKIHRVSSGRGLLPGGCGMVELIQGHIEGGQEIRQEILHLRQIDFGNAPADIFSGVVKFPVAGSLLFHAFDIS